MSAPEKSQRVADTAQKRQRLKAPKSSVQSVKGHVLQVRFHKRRACELAVLEGAAGESGAIEVAVGEVASLEYRIGKQRAGKVAAGEEAIREPGVGRLQLREILVGDDEAARVDGLQRFLCPAAQIVGLQGAQLFRNGRQRQGALGGGRLVGGLDGIGNSGHGGPFFDMAMVVREGHAAGASSDPLTLRPLYYVYEEEGEAWPRRCPRREPLRFESMRPAMVRATPPTMGGVIGSPSTRAEAAPVSAGTR